MKNDTMKQMVKKRVNLTIILVLVLFFNTCKDEEIFVKVISVSLDKTALTLTEGDIISLVATIIPENATNKHISWKSSNEKVASVDDEGKVTALQTGNTVITVTTEDGNKSHTCAISVEELIMPVTGISLDKTELTLVEGDTTSLVATLIPENATNKHIRWKSSNEEVASVDDNGKVTALHTGNTIIVVTTEDGEKSDTCAVVVEQLVIPVTGITLDRKELTLVEGDTTSLVATIIPKDATNKNIGWKSSNEEVASVDDEGKVTALHTGNTIIVVTTVDGEKSDTCAVVVEQLVIPVTGITLDRNELILIEGDTTSLVATLIPENTTNKNIGWKSSNEEVASVNKNGKVTALQAGNVDIVATAEDGDKSDRCTITVLDKMSAFTDLRDGNIYKYVTIGNQVWMAENLKYLPKVNSQQIMSQTKSHYYVNGYDGTNIVAAKATYNYQTFGVIYNWPAAMAGYFSSDKNPSGVQGICPDGWHLPSVLEWNELIEYLGGVSFAGGKLKSTGTIEKGTGLWHEPNTGATNQYGFTAIPSQWEGYGSYASWRNSSELVLGVGLNVFLENGISDAYFNIVERRYGFPVRCIRNDVSGPVYYSVNLEASPGRGGNAGKVGYYEEGESVRLNATEFEGYHFTGWSGDIHLLSNVNTRLIDFTMPSKNVFLTANFEKIAGYHKTFTDTRDGNIYNYVEIGNQVWMAENLMYLPEVSEDESRSDKPCYTVVGYEGTNVEEAKSTNNYRTFGVKYNWYAAENACPEGWHVPSIEEWTQLADYLGGKEIAGGKLKATGTIEDGTGLWKSPNIGTDEYGFTGLPSNNIGRSINWWTPNMPVFENNGYVPGTKWTASIETFSPKYVNVLFLENYAILSASTYIRCIRD